MKYETLRESCALANKQLPATGLVDITFGNVSVYDPEEGVFAIKPSGVDYDKLTAKDIVVLDLEGVVVAGKLRPSSDTPTHRYLYRSFGDKGVRSVVHTHSRTAVAFAQAAIDIPYYGTTHCDYFNGPVPVTRTMTQEEVEGEYEWETGKVIAECYETVSPMEIPAVLVRNHGPFAWGPTPEKALETAFALEVISEIAWKTFQLNPKAPTAPDYLLNKHYSRKHGSNAYYGQEA